MRFGRHIDGSSTVRAKDGRRGFDVTEYTVLIYLNDRHSEPMCTSVSKSTRQIGRTDMDPDTSPGPSMHSTTGTGAEGIGLSFLESETDQILAPLRGGSTAFYTGRYDDEHIEKTIVLDFEPEQGTALLHGHGERCLLHEGKEVSSGVKYLLRTDVIYEGF